MPVLVNCPSCNGPLRVADDLLGRKVRCPSCQTIFEAAEPPPPPPMRIDEEPERIDSWKHLDLEMARDREPPQPTRAPPPPPPPPPPLPSRPPPRQDFPPPSRQEVPPSPIRGLVGAVE